MRKSLGDAERHSNRHDTSDASESPTGKASMLTLVMGMAVTRAVNELYSLNCQIKWPNDVVWEGKKSAVFW